VKNRMRAYYEANPLMVSSPFGGVDAIDHELLHDVFDRLGILLTGRSVLDVGCGRGYVKDVVTECGASYVGADLVKSRGGFPLVLAAATALPFRSASFDGILCIDAFEHFPNPVAAASEFRRLLRPSGFVFLSVPHYGNVAGLVKRWCERFGAYEKNTWAPFRQWQAQELEHLLTPRQVRVVFQRAAFSGFRVAGHAAEVSLGLCPWIEHKRMPEAIKFRLQRFFATIGPAVVRMWPGASLHGFWKIEV